MKKLAVAFQGEKGAYSEMAARMFFNRSLEAIPCQDFETVFKMAQKKNGPSAIVPIENSLAGSIHENYDLLVSRPVPIVGEIKLRVSHALMALPGTTPGMVRRIYSHPQAIAQCRQYLKKWKRAEVVPAYDTAGAVKMIRTGKMKDAAAIASLQAAYDYRMTVLARSIESNKANYTRFLVLGRQKARRSAKWKTSIVFALKNLPGALFKSLGVFAMRDLDLLKIESRPIHGKPWAYLFYLDFAGNQSRELEKNALNHLKEITLFLKVLGSYPVGKVVAPRYSRR